MHTILYVYTVCDSIYLSTCQKPRIVTKAIVDGINVGHSFEKVVQIIKLRQKLCA